MELDRQLAEAKSELGSAETRIGELSSALGACEAEVARKEATVAGLTGRLDERMRWIESLETSAHLHRRRIDELWDALQRHLKARAGIRAHRERVITPYARLYASWNGAV